MDTRFEIYIKQYCIKGDDTTLYLSKGETALLKLKYEDFKTLLLLFKEKALPILKQVTKDGTLKIESSEEE